MSTELHLLLVEDSADDAEILLRVLARSGYTVTHRRVETEEDMAEALAGEDWDLVISDYSLPRFTAPRALAVLRESGKDLPFIVVSGAVGEDTAVSLLKAGAHDFIGKGRMARLVPAIERELREAAGRAGRRSADAALLRSEAQYRRIVETAQDGIWVTTPAGMTRYVNPRMAELLGTGIGELAGVDIRTYVDVAARKAIDASFDDTRVAELRDIEFVRADGSRFVARVSVRDFPTDEGAGVLFMVTDTTEQRRLAAQLLAADRLSSLGMLAAGVAHEINNPLTTLLGSLDAIDGELATMPLAVIRSLDGHRCLINLARAREAADRVRTIARDLRIYSRADNESREEIDLAEVAEGAIRMAFHEIRHRARLERDYRAVPAPRVNASRLGQVLLNLLVNAAQAIPEGTAGRNEIRMVLYTGANGEAVIEVQDSGTGMSPAVRERLFTPFFTTKGPGIGTGLGLSICQRIVQEMNGSIEVDTEPGRGSTFRVTLPVQPAAAEHATPTRPGSGTGRCRVLVLDDEPGTTQALRRELGSEHEVTVRTSALQALAEIRGGARYDVILCDLMIPDMSGMAFHAVLAASFPDQAGRMVFLTGGAYTPQAIAFLAQDQIRRIDKPWERALLLRTVDEVAHAATA